MPRVRAGVVKHEVTPTWRGGPPQSAQADGIEVLQCSRASLEGSRVSCDIGAEPPAGRGPGWLRLRGQAFSHCGRSCRQLVCRLGRRAW
jgi:hypothetical protein